jgi:hypothetical protein
VRCLVDWLMQLFCVHEWAPVETIPAYEGDKRRPYKKIKTTHCELCMRVKTWEIWS